MRGKPPSERVSEREVFQRFLEVFRGFSEVLRGLQRFLEAFRVFLEGCQRSSRRPSQRKISVSEALSLVAPNRVALELSPNIVAPTSRNRIMGHKVLWKTGGADLSLCNVVTTHFLQQEAVLSPCSFVTAHLTAVILHVHLPLTSRPMKWRTLSQQPKFLAQDQRKEFHRKRQKTRTSRVQEVIRVQQLLSSGVRKFPKRLFCSVSVQSERGGSLDVSVCAIRIRIR